MYALFTFAFVMLPFEELAAEETGWFGFSLDVNVEGLFDTTVRSIKVEKVAPSSPAAVKDVKVGDLIVEIEGVPVAGEKASKLKALMRRAVGQSLTLRLKRNGEFYSVALVAARKPD